MGGGRSIFEKVRDQHRRSRTPDYSDAFQYAMWMNRDRWRRPPVERVLEKELIKRYGIEAQAQIIYFKAPKYVDPDYQTEQERRGITEIRLVLCNPHLRGMTAVWCNFNVEGRDGQNNSVL